MLSRVVPHDACLSTSTSGIPYLAKNPFSTAITSGELSVSAMKPSTARVVSGVSAGAAQTPLGNAARTAESSAAALVSFAVPMSRSRRLMPPADFMMRISLCASPGIQAKKGRPGGRRCPSDSTAGARERPPSQGSCQGCSRETTPRARTGACTGMQRRFLGHAWCGVRALPDSD